MRPWWCVISVVVACHSGEPGPVTPVVVDSAPHSKSITSRCRTAEHCRCPAGMRFIPEGDVASFCLDTRETRVSDYRQCVAAKSCRVPSPKPDEWKKCTVLTLPEPLAGSSPASCLSFSMAGAFCEWAGKRLPHAAEWQWAAAGREEARQYPWGPDEIRSPCSTASGCYELQPIDADVSRDGIRDMAGGIVEWTIREDGHPMRCGGHYQSPLPAKSCRESQEPDLRSRVSNGVRCAAEPIPIP